MMIGDGLTFPKVKEIIEKAGRQESVSFPGVVEQQKGPKYLSACDVLVCPHVPNSDGTVFFGSPTKLFEYMACGKAILASALGQIEEVIEHDVNGWLTEPGKIDSLVTGLEILVSDPLKRSRLGKNSRSRVMASYTWAHHTKKILDKVVAVYLRSPKSYTGEDMLEISTHGSRAIIKGFIEVFTKTKLSTSL